MIATHWMAAQCPCSGGDGGLTSLLLLALVLGLWQSVKWAKTPAAALRGRWRRAVPIATSVVLVAAIVAILAVGWINLPQRIADTPGVAGPAAQGGRPQLLDLGSKDCIPCKMMAPILEELGREYQGVMNVRFVDVNLKENVPLARQYGVQRIPTQVFLSADGRELWRHEGFLAKDAILAKWNDLGYDLAAPAPASSQPQLDLDSPPTTEPSQN
jgi:thioredoxin 1